MTNLMIPATHFAVSLMTCGRPEVLLTTGSITLAGLLTTGSITLAGLLNTGSITLAGLLTTGSITLALAVV